MGSGVSISSTLLVASRAESQVQRPAAIPRAEARDEASSRDSRAVTTSTRLDSSRLDLATVADAKSVAPALSSRDTESARPEPTPAAAGDEGYSKQAVARAASRDAEALEPEEPAPTPPKGSTVDTFL